MTIEIIIRCDNATQARMQMEALLTGGSNKSEDSNKKPIKDATGSFLVPTANIDDSVNEKEPESATEIVEEKKERKPRGPNKKKDEAKVEAPTPPPAKTPENETPTLDNCRNWVKAVAAKNTLEAAQNIVIGFGVSKVGELPEDKYPDFISACKDALSGEEKTEGGELFS